MPAATQDEQKLLLRPIKQRRRELLKELDQLERREDEILGLSPSGQKRQSRRNPVAERYGFDGALRE